MIGPSFQRELLFWRRLSFWRRDSGHERRAMSSTFGVVSDPQSSCILCVGALMIPDGRRLQCLTPLFPRGHWFWRGAGGMGGVFGVVLLFFKCRGTRVTGDGHGILFWSPCPSVL